MFPLYIIYVDREGTAGITGPFSEADAPLELNIRGRELKPGDELLLLDVATLKIVDLRKRDFNES